MLDKIIFCNVSGMKFYNFNTLVDIPKNGGKFVFSNKNVGEQINFYKWKDGFYRGYVAINNDINKPFNLNINKIINFNGDAKKVDDVTVVFCTKSNLPNMTEIVGFYKHATIYRCAKNHNGYRYFFETTDARLIPESIRKSIVPRKNGHKTGFGQSNIWYANNGKPETQNLINQVMTYINSF